MIERILFRAILVSFGLSSALLAREWTDATGKFKVEAEIEDVVGEVVLLRKPDDKVIRVPLRRLSEDDLWELASWSYERSTKGLQRPGDHFTLTKLLEKIVHEARVDKARSLSKRFNGVGDFREWERGRTRMKGVLYDFSEVRVLIQWEDGKGHGWSFFGDRSRPRSTGFVFYQLSEADRKFVFDRIPGLAEKWRPTQEAIDAIISDFRQPMGIWLFDKRDGDYHYATVTSVDLDSSYLTVVDERAPQGNVNHVWINGREMPFYTSEFKYSYNPEIGFLKREPLTEYWKQRVAKWAKPADCPPELKGDVAAIAGKLRGVRRFCKAQGFTDWAKGYCETFDALNRAEFPNVVLREEDREHNRSSAYIREMTTLAPDEFRSAAEAREIAEGRARRMDEAETRIAAKLNEQSPAETFFVYDIAFSRGSYDAERQCFEWFKSSLPVDADGKLEWFPREGGSSAGSSSRSGTPKSGVNELEISMNAGNVEVLFPPLPSDQARQLADPDKARVALVVKFPGYCPPARVAGADGAASPDYAQHKPLVSLRRFLVYEPIGGKIVFDWIASDSSAWEESGRKPYHKM